ncbi:MAG: nicotinate-nucleotide diphosphorylase (carboxylating), partial [Chryseobacterium sp.]
GEAIHKAHEYVRKHKPDLKIEVETRNLIEVKEAVKSGADRIMFDNMPVEMMAEAVKIVNSKSETEASGGITRDVLNSVAKTGVDFISAGAITHSSSNIDLSLKALKI